MQGWGSLRWHKGHTKCHKNRQICSKSLKTHTHLYIMVISKAFLLQESKMGWICTILYDLLNHTTDLKNAWTIWIINYFHFKFSFRYDDPYVSVLSLFTIVQFPNEPCQTSEGVNGTCYHHLQCRSLGGISSGSCAQGYGICCYCKYGICLNACHLTKQSTFHTGIHYGHLEPSKSKIIHVHAIEAFWTRH
jgi:hypothetical protein